MRSLKFLRHTKNRTHLQTTSVTGFFRKRRNSKGNFLWLNSCSSKDCQSFSVSINQGPEANVSRNTRFSFTTVAKACLFIVGSIYSKSTRSTPLNQILLLLFVLEKQKSRILYWLLRRSSRGLLRWESWHVGLSPWQVG